MKNAKIGILLLFLISGILAISFRDKTSHQLKTKILQDTIIEAPYASYELPVINSTDNILIREKFIVDYDVSKKCAYWSAYKLIKAEKKYPLKRLDRFIADTNVGTATDNDYRGTNYDKGHLTPAEDMSINAQTMRESFSYINVVPQNPHMNRGIWKHLENQVRKWGTIFDTLYITTGTIF